MHKRLFFFYIIIIVVLTLLLMMISLIISNDYKKQPKFAGSIIIKYFDINLFDKTAQEVIKIAEKNVKEFLLSTNFIQQFTEKYLKDSNETTSNFDNIKKITQLFKNKVEFNIITEKNDNSIILNIQIGFFTKDSKNADSLINSYILFFVNNSDTYLKTIEKNITNELVFFNKELEKNSNFSIKNDVYIFQQINNMKKTISYKKCAKYEDYRYNRSIIYYILDFFGIIIIISLGVFAIFVLKKKYGFKSNKPPYEN